MRNLMFSSLLIALVEMDGPAASAKTHKPSVPIALLAATSPKLPGAVELSWHTVKGAHQYTVSASRETDSNWHNLGTTHGTNYQVNELPEGTKYYFRIASNAKHGQSPWSHEAIQYSSATSDFRPALLLPQNFHTTAKPSKRGELVMEWSPVVGARSYAVQICDAQDCGDTHSERGVFSRFAGDEYFHDLSVVPGTRFLSTGLIGGKSYQFRIAGIDAKGHRGDYSRVLGGLAP